MKARRRCLRWLKRLVIGVVAALIVLFLAIQVVLATPWARGRLSKKVTGITGLECRVDGISWTPWGGLGLEGMEVSQPAQVAAMTDRPLLKVASMHVHPDYLACLRRQWRVRSIEVEAPEIQLSVEMLVSVANAALTTQPTVPSLAVREPSPPPTVPVPSGEGGRPIEGPEPVVPPSEVVAPPAAKPPERKPRSPVQIKVTGGEFSVFWAAEEFSVLRVSRAEIQGSLGSKDKPLQMRIGEVAIVECSIETNVPIELEARRPVVKVAIKNSSEKDAQIVGGVLVMIQNGLPFQAAGSLNLNERFSSVLPKVGEVSIASHQTMVQGGGLLLNPSTWRLIGRSEGGRIEIKGPGVAFDRHQGEFALNQGLLQIRDARCIGEPVSLLGNGWMARGAGAGVLRLVIPSDLAAWVGAKLEVGELPSLPPGNRRFLDFETWREPNGWKVEYGGRRDSVSEFLSTEFWSLADRPADALDE